MWDFLQHMMYSQRNVIYCRLKQKRRLPLKLNRDLEVQLVNLIDTKRSLVISQVLYFPLHFAFVNNMDFLFC